MFSASNPLLISNEIVAAGTKAFYGMENTTNTFWVPLPNPSVIACQQPKLPQVHLLFKTVGNAVITGLQVYDGMLPAGTVSGLSLSGDVSLLSRHKPIAIRPPAEVTSSVTIGITVRFGAKSGAQLPMIQFVSIGADFCSNGIDVQVYDAKNQYLGILLGHDYGESTGTPWVEIFSPVLDKTIRIDKQSGEVSAWQYLYYASGNCSGTAYSGGPTDIVFTGPDGKYHYAPSGRPVETMVSSLNEWGYCYEGGDTIGLTEVLDISEKDIPFKVPVVLPLQYRVR